ncbi:hypothetical protein KU6B_03310 [Mameliella alba]|uniref:hypothetical protein n=1 Tax=Roseobacteraceae TaxID=2854170 RepID=UPI0013E4C9E1|nr:hypothetical protein [Mameliella alba]BBU54066.1 hypothetical protein KU6B_03310 [Mameliella alba]
MKAMGFMTTHVSAFALRAAEPVRAKNDCDDNGFVGLNAVESISLIGKHDGVLDDDLFDLLAVEAA